MNMHNRILILIAVMLSWPMTGMGALDRVEEAYEVSLDQVTLPAHSASQVIIRRCSDCDPVLLPVNAQTTYKIGSEKVDLATLRDLASGGSSALVIILYSPDTGVVTRIVLP